MVEIKTAKTHKGKRELEKRAPKLVESGKKTLILHGTKTSSVLKAVLSEIYHLKKESSIKYSRKNDNVKPFESGGETSLEFFSLKTDCSIFVYGSHSKKRPNNLVIGRTYDHHIYDLVEVGVENFKSMESFSYDKKLAPKEGSKPFITFIGEGFENVEELKHLKEVLLDLFRGAAVENINLAGLDRAYVFTALSSNREKNVKKDAIEGKVGNIYIPDQKIGEMALPNKAKGVKRERREAKLKNASGEHERSSKRKKEDI
ncbi:hypothetical protein K1719_031710 [Acacia pycnantha]|nr:hypothetical protein K1719_031710 [Acacia pycnantha]